MNPSPNTWPPLARSRDVTTPLTHQHPLIYTVPVTTTAASPDLARAARLFHALSDETRLAVLDMLRSGEQCVCDLQGALDAAQSRLSFHLKVLKDAGLVRDRKEGRWSYYAIDPDALAELESLVESLRPGLVRITRRSPGAKSGKSMTSGTGSCCR